MEREGRPALSLLIRLQQMRCKLSVCELGLRRVPQNGLMLVAPREAAPRGAGSGGAAKENALLC